MRHAHVDKLLGRYRTGIGLGRQLRCAGMKIAFLEVVR
jgi:hypothetical protein